MKRAFLIICFFVVVCSSSFATYWVGRITTDVNLREGPSTLDEIITVIHKNSFVFYDDENFMDGFYQVIYLDEDIYGYVFADYIEKCQEVKVDESGQIQFIGEAEINTASVDVINNANVPVTLKVNDTIYKLSINSRQTIDVEPGMCKVTASSPGLTPYVGSQYLRVGLYEWTIFVRH